MNEERERSQKEEGAKMFSKQYISSVPKERERNRRED